MHNFNVYDSRFRKLFTVEAVDGKDAIKQAKEKHIFAPIVHQLDSRGKEVYQEFDK